MNKKIKIFGILLSMALMISFIPMNITADTNDNLPQSNTGEENLGNTPETRTGEATSQIYKIKISYDSTQGTVSKKDSEGTLTKIEPNDVVEVVKEDILHMVAEPLENYLFVEYRYNITEDGYNSYGRYDYEDFKPTKDETVEVVFEAINQSANIDVTTADFGRTKPGYKPYEAKTITIENTGNVDYLVFEPVAKYYEISDFKNIAGPMCMNLSEPEEPSINTVPLGPKEKITFTVRPKDGLPVGKYDEALAINVLKYEYIDSDELNEENFKEYISVLGEVNLKFEVYEEQKQPVHVEEKPVVVVPNTATKTK